MKQIWVTDDEEDLVMRHRRDSAKSKKDAEKLYGVNLAHAAFKGHPRAVEELRNYVKPASE